MDWNTKIEAVTKLNRMLALVAYPEELRDNEKIDEYYKNLVIDPKSLFKTELNLNRFKYDLKVQSLDKIVDSYDWSGIFADASTINAFYAPTSNALSMQQ